MDQLFFLGMNFWMLYQLSNSKKLIIKFMRHVQNKKNKINFFYKKHQNPQIKKLKNFKLINKNGIIEYPEYGLRN